MAETWRNGDTLECVVTEHRLDPGSAAAKPSRSATLRMGASGVKDRKKLFRYKEMNVQPFSAHSFVALANYLKFRYLRVGRFGVPIAIPWQRLLARDPRCKEGADSKDPI